MKRIRISWNDERKVKNSRKADMRLRFLILRSIYAALKFEKFDRDVMVSVTLTDNEGIHAKNLEFRGIDAPTDVLSFPMYDMNNEELPPEGFIELGDIVLSTERAAEQAYEFGHSYERECAFLTVHSVLHLLGYDHVDNREDELLMRRHQRAIMRGMGLDVR